MSTKGLMGQLMMLLKGSKLNKLSPEVNSGEAMRRRSTYMPITMKQRTELMKAFDRSRSPEEAMKSFKNMLHPFHYVEARVCATLVRSFAKINKHEFCYPIQTMTVKVGIDTNEEVQQSLVEFYGSRGHLVECHYVFQKRLGRSIFMWNLMINLHVDKEEIYGSHVLFQVLIRVGFAKPNQWTLTSVINSMPHDSYEMLSCVHTYIEKSGSYFSSVRNSLMSAYASLGYAEEALQFHDETSHTPYDVYWWNSLITVYAIHGKVDEAFTTFREMTESGERPDGITMLSLLDVCGHTGRIKEAIELYEVMFHKHGVRQNKTHFACLVACLGRGGHFEEVVTLISSADSKDRDALWRTMAIMCNLSDDFENGFWALDNISSLSANDWRIIADLYFKSGNYIASEKAWEQHNKMKSHKYIGISATC